MPLTPGRIARLRLRAQGLVGASTAGPADAARRMLALQGQDPASVLWSLGLRAGSDEAGVRAAFDRGEIVRSWTMRGTLHAVAAEDLRLLLSLTAERQRRAVSTRQVQLGVAPGDIEAAADAARTLLRGGGRAIRAELYAAFEEAGQPTSTQRGYHLIYALALDDVLCLGPYRGAEQCFVLNEEWLPPARKPDPERDAAEIARRYLASHGPASERDLAWWAKIPVTQARSAIAALGDAVTQAEGPGGRLWAESEAWDASTPAARRILLLPGFDEMLLGYADRTASLPPVVADRIVPGGNGVFLATIVQDGRVIGTWRRRSGARTVTVLPTGFEELDEAARRGVAREARRYAAFLGADAELRWE